MGVLDGKETRFTSPQHVTTSDTETKTMKTMTNPTEFYSIHKSDSEFLKITNNFAMRVFLASYGFKASRTITDQLMALRTTDLETKVISTTCGDTIFIYEEGTADEVNKQIETKMLREGTSRIERDGTTIFYRDMVVVDLNADHQDIEIYTWDKSGNRVKFARHRITTKDGEILNDEITKHVFKVL